MLFIAEHARGTGLPRSDLRKFQSPNPLTASPTRALAKRWIAPIHLAEFSERDVRAISIAGRRGQLDELEQAVRKVLELRHRERMRLAVGRRRPQGDPRGGPPAAPRGTSGTEIKFTTIILCWQANSQRPKDRVIEAKMMPLTDIKGARCAWAD